MEEGRANGGGGGRERGESASRQGGARQSET
jgi:hypothetical protein